MKGDAPNTVHEIVEGIMTLKSPDGIPLAIQEMKQSFSQRMRFELAYTNVLANIAIHSSDVEKDCDILTVGMATDGPPQGRYRSIGAFVFWLRAARGNYP